MKRALILVLFLTSGVVMSSRAADAYIGEGVQGRPHGGHASQRMLYKRHGMKVPAKYRHHYH